GNTFSSSRTMSVARTRTLSATGSSSEPNDVVRPVRRAMRPSNQSVDIARQKTTVPQYSWLAKSTVKSTTTRGAAAIRASVSWSASGTTGGYARRLCRLAGAVDLYEHQGKELLARFGIPVSRGRLAFTAEEARRAAEELGGTVVVKAQVL